jgi:hypothetical protein
MYILLFFLYCVFCCGFWCRCFRFYYCMPNIPNSHNKFCLFICGTSWFWLVGLFLFLLYIFCLSFLFLYITFDGRDYC